MLCVYQAFNLSGSYDTQSCWGFIHFKCFGQYCQQMTSLWGLSNGLSLLLESCLLTKILYKACTLPVPSPFPSPHSLPSEHELLRGLKQLFTGHGSVSMDTAKRALSMCGGGTQGHVWGPRQAHAGHKDPKELSLPGLSLYLSLPFLQTF